LQKNGKNLRFTKKKFGRIDSKLPFCCFDKEKLLKKTNKVLCCQTFYNFWFNYKFFFFFQKQQKQQQQQQQQDEEAAKTTSDLEISASSSSSSPAPLNVISVKNIPVILPSSPLPLSTVVKTSSSSPLVVTSQIREKPDLVKFKR
jgi:hypothetical protein